MITFQKYFVYILCSLLLGASILLMPQISDSLSSIYALVIGTFIGIDIVNTVLKTKSLPPGEFKEAKKDRYITTSIVSTLLIALALVVDGKGEVSLLNTITLLSMTLMSIGAMYISVLEANKLVTGKKEEKEKEVQKLQD